MLKKFLVQRSFYIFCLWSFYASAIANPCDPTNRISCARINITINGAGAITNPSTGKDSFDEKSKSDLQIFSGNKILVKQFAFSNSDDVIPKSIPPEKIKRYPTTLSSWQSFIEKDIPNVLEQMRNDDGCNKLLGPKVKTMSLSELSQFLKVDVNINTHTLIGNSDSPNNTIPFNRNDIGPTTAEEWSSNTSNQAEFTTQQMTQLRESLPNAMVTGFVSACHGAALGKDLFPFSFNQCSCFISATDNGVSETIADARNYWAYHNTPPLGDDGLYSKPWGSGSVLELAPASYSATTGIRTAKTLIDGDIVGNDSIYGNYEPIDKGAAANFAPANPLIGFNKTSAHQAADDVLVGIAKGDWASGGNNSAKAKQLLDAQFIIDLPANSNTTQNHGLVDMGISAVTSKTDSMFRASEGLAKFPPNFNISDNAYRYTELFKVCFSDEKDSSVYARDDAANEKFYGKLDKCKRLYAFLKSQGTLNDPKVVKFLTWVKSSSRQSESKVQKLFKSPTYKSPEEARQVAQFWNDFSSFRSKIASDNIRGHLAGRIPETSHDQVVESLQTASKEMNNLMLPYFEKSFDFFQRNAFAVNLAKIKAAAEMLESYTRKNPDQTEALKKLAELKAQVDCITKYALGDTFDSNELKRRENFVVQNHNIKGARVMPRGSDPTEDVQVKDPIEDAKTTNEGTR